MVRLHKRISVPVCSIDFSLLIEERRLQVLLVNRDSRLLDCDSIGLGICLGSATSILEIVL